MNEIRENIILIGMPGCGKSTVGVVLAKELGYSFIDSDLEIQNREGIRLCEIIQKKGIDEFRRIEEEVNLDLNPNRSVIATGGSVIYCENAMEHLKSIGSVIYLKLPYEEIKERLGDWNERGVSARPGQTLCDLYNERIPIYEKYADVTVECLNHLIREIVAQIRSLFIR